LTIVLIGTDLVLLYGLKAMTTTLPLALNLIGLALFVMSGLQVINNGTPSSMQYV
jgi:hypothetical protein